MASFNKVLLMGNLTRDVEMRYTPSGMGLAQLGLAVNRKYRDSKTNELREEVTFVDIEVWGKQAEVANQYLSKGRPVFIEGRLKLDQWDDKQTGQKRSKLKVVAERIHFLPGGGGQGGQGGGGRPPQQRPQQGGGRQAPPAPDQMEGPPDSGGEDLDIQEDSIPF
ncbi:MAG TPA: single-stranded DNA-binding protein [Planctomycetota bacterium]|nr:single-stranded DNA-binding protein [Planctomycetota bacterium]